MSVLAYHRTLSLPWTERSFLQPVHPLARRMTLVQKIVLQLFRDLEASVPQLCASLSDPLGGQAFINLDFAEGEAMFRLVDEVAGGRLPVSPSAFQNSVPNAASGYISMVSALKSNCITESSGFLGFDRCLFAAHAALSSGLRSCVLILRASEYSDRSLAYAAFGECLVLSSAERAKTWELLECRYRADHPTPIPKLQKSSLLPREREGLQAVQQGPECLLSPPLLLPASDLSSEQFLREQFLRREATNAFGETIESVWRLSDRLNRQ